MRKLLIRNGAALSIIALIAGGAVAQTPPSALADMPGVSFEGQIGGMDVWSVPGSDQLYAVTPDGRTLVRGTIFSGSGRDIGAALTGTPSSDLFTGEVDVSTTEIGGGAVPDQTPLMVNTDTSSGFSALIGPDSCQSPILRQADPAVEPRFGRWDAQGGGGASDALPSANANSASDMSVPRDENGLVDGAGMAREAEDALAGFDAAERRDLLLGLVEGLRDAQTQEQFLSAIAAWRVEIDQMRQARGLPRLYSDDGIQPLPQVGSATLETMLPTPPQIEVQTLESKPAVEDISLEQTLLEDVRYNAMWFSVGANDAPSIYAFIDPTCFYSARAISALSDQVGAGEVQLRVILAPVLSQQSAGLIAGILTDDRPPLAFFDHEVELAERGRSDLAPAEFSGLPAPVQAGIQRNFEMLRDYGIPGVPFFVYETADGARVLSGAPEGISFPGALNDPYTGTK